MPETILSAVVTCYKDGPAIESMYGRLTQVFCALGVEYEIIFVNDASPDDADLKLASLTAGDQHVIAIEHSRNFGSQNAFISGMEVATGDAVVLLDGDLQDPPELIAQFFARWRDGYDVVYGCREKREGSRLLQFFARSFYRVFRRLSEVPMPLDAGDFSLIDRKVVNILLAFPERDQFVRGLRAWSGFKQVGVDYLRPERAFGRSTHSFFKNIWWAKKGIFSFSSLPIELVGYTGAIMTALSTMGIFYQLIDTIRRPEVSHIAGWLIALVAWFGSLQLLALGLLGEYVIKILEESKQRPKFIRKAVRHGDQHLLDAAEIEQFVQQRKRRNTEVLSAMTSSKIAARGMR